jgi:thiamine-monophosphate kinase
MSSTPSEFQIIKRYFEGVGEIDTRIISLGIGDDCAVVTPPENKSLCFSLDTMVEGRHFLPGISPDKLAIRAMAAALSDLAAMGAEPSFFTLSLTLPDADIDWLRSFSQGLRFMADKYRLCLVGGDTTRGPLTVAVQVHGFVNQGKELRRSGAQVGDVLVVTGSLGDAGAALALLEVGAPDDVEAYLLDRYYQPSPRFEEARLILDYASSCIDVSDGLLADARHIAEASACGLSIDIDALPLSQPLLEFAGDKAPVFALSSGDDYELLFTISEDSLKELENAGLAGRFTSIGRVEIESKGVCVYSQGKEVLIGSEGFKHFE